MGPNGSGKSNVIDAMLFVFGKRAKQVKWKLLFCEFLLFLVFKITYDCKLTLRIAAEDAIEQSIGADT